MFSITKLHLKNYVTYQNQKFDFDKLFEKSNILLIYGRNNDDISFANDNGSGKSIIYQAMLWAITGKTTRNTNGDLLIGKFAKSMSVSLTIFDDKDNKYWICRYRKNSVYGNEVRLKINGEEKKKGKSREMTEFISEVLGISYKRIINTSIFESDDERSRFIYLGDKDGKALLSQIKGLDVFQRCYQVAKKDYDNLNSNFNQVKKDIDVKQLTLNALDLEYKDMLDKEAEYSKTQLKKANDIKLEIAVETKRLVKFSKETKRQLARKKLKLKKLKEHEVKEENIKELEEKIETIKEQFTRGSIEIQNALNNVKSEKTLLKQLQKSESKVGKECEYCGNIISNEQLDKKISSTKNFIKMEESNIIIKEEHTKSLSKQLSSLNKELEASISLNKKHEKEISDMEAYIERDRYDLKTQLKNRNKTVMMLTKKLKEIKHEKNVLSETISRIKKTMSKLKDEISNLEEKENSMLEAIKYKEVWVNGYSKEELQNELLKSTVIELNSEMQRISDILTDGTVTVELATERQLRNKNIKNIFEFKISDINKKNLPFVEWSKGQKKRIEIIVSFALMNIEENIIQEVFLDELFDGIDEIGMGKIKTLLENESNKYKRFVIFSHSKEIKSLFSNTAYIELNDGTSTLHIN